MTCKEIIQKSIFNQIKCAKVRHSKVKKPTDKKEHKTTTVGTQTNMDSNTVCRHIAAKMAVGLAFAFINTIRVVNFEMRQVS